MARSSAKSFRFFPAILGGARGGSRPKRKGKARAFGGLRLTGPQRGALSFALAILLGLSYWFGLLPRVVDAVSGPPGRYDITGQMRVVDGDTLRFAKARIRLNGIDAPEHDQTCIAVKTGKAMACGEAASAALEAITGGREVRCLSEGIDRYGRTLGQCWVTIGAEEVDIARRMVRQGWAVAYRRYSTRYAYDETAARVEGAGLWATEFEVPEDYRREARAER